MIFIGIDLGTSSIKVIASDEKGKVLGSNSIELDCIHQNNGWSEQNPNDWYECTIQALKELFKNECILLDEIKAISFSGQMHGLVILDEKDEVIRPAILWNDNRSYKEVEYLNTKVGVKKLSDLCGNIAFSGFTAPKILWLKNNEPDHFNKIKKIMLPKDYLAYKLCGNFCSDVSDASGTLLYDVKNRTWSQEMLEICSVSNEQLPTVYESYEKVGMLKANIAAELGIKGDVAIIAGGGDNACAALGTGTVEEGDCNISLGTSGTIFIPSSEFKVDSNNALHSFASACGEYHLMGCILSAASANKWWMDNILMSDAYQKEQINITSTGEKSLYFLPYLMGERSPINDSFARGCFIGLSLDTTRVDMTQAILEGVAFALRDCYEVSLKQNIHLSRVTICGGGSKSKIWKQIFSNVFNVPIITLDDSYGPGYGACMLAMKGYGVVEDLKLLSKSLVHETETIEPELNYIETFNYKYDVYKHLYEALKPEFPKL